MSLIEVLHHRRLLVGSELWLCIAQLARSKAELGPEFRTDEAAASVAALLSCDIQGVAPIDRDCDNAQMTRLLILPELSLSWEDWETVDAAVKSYNKSLVVIAGMGFTKVSAMREGVSFLDAGVSDDRHVNYGCAWLQIPAAEGMEAISEVHYYCKNFAEQSAEAPHFDPYLGSDHLVLTFDDCIIAPVICADLLADTQAGKPNVIDKLKDYKLTKAQPVVVAASVLQDKPWHEIWSSRIDRVVDGDLILAIANFSHANRPSHYDDDGSRNLSGAYARAGLISNASPQTLACNRIDKPTSKGSVLRDSCQMFAAGVLRVSSFSATTGRHLWMSRWAQEFANGGFQTVQSRLKFEIPRLCHRTRHLSPSHNHQITEVVAHLSTATDSRRTSFFHSIADGPMPSSRDPDPASDSGLNEAAETALLAADALVRTEFLRWPSDEWPTVRVNISTANGDALFSSDGYIWRSASETWSTMAAKLQGYAQNTSPLPAIVVFGEDVHSVDLSSDDVGIDRDSTAPNEVGGDFDPAAPRPNSNAVIVVPFSQAKRLSGELRDPGQFALRAKSLRMSIIKATGLTEE